MLCGMESQGIPQAEAQLLVVAESLLSRAGLSALLEERGCLVLSQVDGRQLQLDIERLNPDALVVDLGWTADDMLGRLVQVDSDLPILALAAELSEADDPNLMPLLETLRLYPQFALLPRDCQPDTIIAALEALAAGLTVIHPRLASQLSAAGRAAANPQHDPLTAREHEVLQLLALGLTNRAIAHELGITQHTVKFHVNAIMSKLDAQSRTQAVVRATQLGMIVL